MQRGKDPIVPSGKGASSLQFPLGKKKWDISCKKNVSRVPTHSHGQRAAAGRLVGAPRGSGGAREAEEGREAGGK